MHLHVSFAYSRAFYLYIVPSGLCLMVNTHLHPIDLFSNGKFVHLQVLFYSRTFISPHIAALSYDERGYPQH